MNTVLRTKLNIEAGDKACLMLNKEKKGRVCGAFSRALYCRLEDEILLFHDKKWGLVPFGMAISDIRAFLEEAEASFDDDVALYKDRITVGGKSFEIRLVPHCGPAPAKPFSLSHERLRAVEKYVSEHGSPNGMAELISLNRGGARDALEKLVSGDFSAAKRLVGLGRGLTPSGDDFLCGFCSLLRALCAPETEEFCTCVRDSLCRTTDISAAYLNAVLDGEYFTIYDRAVRALTADEPFEANCDFVLEMGASSGSDTMLGVIYAAEMILKKAD